MNGHEIEGIETIGKKYTLNDVVKEVEKDIVLYEESGGGITISGGEPFYQFDFLLELLKNLKHQEFHTCIDTTGHARKDELIKAAFKIIQDWIE